MCLHSVPRSPKIISPDLGGPALAQVRGRNTTNDVMRGMCDKCKLPDILVAGKFDRRQVTVRHVRKGLVLRREQEEYVEQQWQQLVANWATSHSGSTLAPYPGKLFSLLDFRFSNLGLDLSVGEFSFDEYVVSMMPEFIERFGDIEVVPITVGAVVTASDNRIVLGEGRPGTEEIETIAGFMEREDPDTHEELSPHPFDQMERELAEESGVDLKDIQTMTCLGLLGHGQPYVVFDVRLSIPCEVLACERTPRDREFRRLFSIRNDPDSLRSFVLDNKAAMTSHCLSNLLLWGKYAFEGDWYGSLLHQL